MDNPERKQNGPSRMDNPERKQKGPSRMDNPERKQKGPSRMDNPEKLATLGTQDTGRRQTKQRAIKNGQSRETGNIVYTRYRTKTNKTRGHQEWIIQRENKRGHHEWTIQRENKRDHQEWTIQRENKTCHQEWTIQRENKTGHQEWTIQRKWQYWVHKIQDENKQNKGPSRMNNPEKLATLGIQDTGQRQAKQGAIKNGQSRETGNIGYTRYRTKTNKTRGLQEWIIQRHWQHWVHKTQDEDKQN
jgi:hypothetical protein